MDHHLNFKEVFKVGPPGVFVCKTKKSYQIPTTSKIPKSSFLNRPVANKSHLSASVLTQDTSKTFLAEDGLWNVLGLLSFDPDLAHPFGELGRTRRWGDEKAFGQRKWWDSILQDVMFFCVRIVSVESCSFSLYVLLPYARKMITFVERMVPFSFNNLKHPCSLYPLQASVSSSSVDDIPTQVAWGIKWNDPFNIWVKWVPDSTAFSRREHCLSPLPGILPPLVNLRNPGEVFGFAKSVSATLLQKRELWLSRSPILFSWCRSGPLWRVCDDLSCAATKLRGCTLSPEASSPSTNPLQQEVE